MPNVCLICPPSPFLLDERVFPFLGILKIASAWREQGCSVEVLDLSGIDNYHDAVADYLNNTPEIDFIGITATTPQMPNAFALGELIKGGWPQHKLVLGGSHVTLMHTAAKNEISDGIEDGRARRDIDRIRQYYDVLVCGDGELTLNEILNLKSGVIDVDDQKSPMFLTNESFSTLPEPDRSLIDLDSYHYFIEGERATSIISQLGCPFRCSFCSGRSSPYLRKIRNRSWQSVVQEIEAIYLTYGYKGIMLYDDELNVNKSMIDLMYGIANLAEKHGIEFKLRGFIKAELFTEEQARAMYAAGFRVILTGFESGDDRILTNIDKIATRDANTRCVEIAKKHDLKVKALMSIGHAGESYETIQNTRDWLLEVEPEDFDCTLITTYPGSPYFDHARWDGEKFVYTHPKTGDKLFQKDINYTEEVNHYKGIPGEYTSFVWTEHLSAAQLAEARDELEKDVREKLNIPFNLPGAATKYEHSMGQGNVALPDWILRKGEPNAGAEPIAPLSLIS